MIISGVRGYCAALAVTIVVFVACQTQTRAAATEASFWDTITFLVPNDITSFKIQPSNLDFEKYVFFSSDRENVILTASYDVLDNEGGGIGFFSAQQISASNKITLNGLSAWRLYDGPYTKINIRLPTVKACSMAGHEFALLVFVRADPEAVHMAATFRAKNPYPCIDGKPIP